MATRGADLAERVQVCRSRLTEEPAPRIASDSQDAREAGPRGPKSHGANERGQVAAQGAHPRARTGAGVDGRDQKERGSR